MPCTEREPRRRGRKARRVSIASLLLLNITVSFMLGMNAYIAGQRGPGQEIIDTGGIGTAIVHRDEHGVPRIVASTMEALFFAQGYVQGRDGLFIADMARRVGSGRLAVLLGDSQVEHDHLMRAIGIPAIAHASIARTSEATLRLCQAYIDGINHYVTRTGRVLPVEYDILKAMGLPMDHAIEPFTIEDIMHVMLYFAFEFSSNLGFNVGMRDFINAIGIDAFGEFKQYLKIGNEYNVTADCLNSAMNPPGAKHGIPRLASAPKLSIATQLLGEFKGSNAWVVSGTRTASGRAIFATDPHMKVSTPGLLKSWHLACESSGLVLIGAQLPLVPGIFMGRSNHVAWGMTAPFFDCGDAWIEKLNADGTSYFYNGSFHPTRRETIQITSSSGTIHERTVTRVPGHGVMLDIDGTIVSFRWSAMIDERPASNGSALLDALFRLFVAENAGDILAISNPEDGWDEFPLHLLFAARNGDIGFVATGKIPVRGPVPSQGAIPLDGTDPANDWIRFNNASEIQHVVNPPAGFLHAANTKIDFPTSGSPPVYLAPGWGNAYRHNRIGNVLEAKENITVEDVRELQGDLLDYWAPFLVPVISGFLHHFKAAGEPYASALDRLASWNHLYTAGSEGATVYAAFLKHFGHGIFGDELCISMDGHEHPTLQAVFKHLVHPEILLNLTMDHDHSPVVRNFFNDIRTGDVENVSTIVMRSFQGAIDELVSILGPDTGSWTWSRFNHVEVEHPFNANDRVLGFLNLGPYEMDGGHCVRLQRGNEGAATRIIVEWTDPVTTSMVTPPGPVGNLFSPFKDSEMTLHAGNLLKLYDEDAGLLPAILTFR